MHTKAWLLAHKLIELITQLLLMHKFLGEEYFHLNDGSRRLDW